MEGVQAGRKGELAGGRGGSSPPGALSRPGRRWALGGLREVSRRAGGGMRTPAVRAGKGDGWQMHVL